MARLMRQLLILVLAAFLSAGPSWPPAHAKVMPEKMTARMDSDAGSCGGCHKCPMNGDEHAKAFMCGKPMRDGHTDGGPASRTGRAHASTPDVRSP